MFGVEEWLVSAVMSMYTGAETVVRTVYGNRICCEVKVGIFVAEKWVDGVVIVEWHSKRVLILKMVLDSGLLNVLMVYVSHSGKLEEEKESFF